MGNLRLVEDLLFACVSMVPLLPATMLVSKQHLESLWNNFVHTFVSFVWAMVPAGDSGLHRLETPVRPETPGVST
jgi:hypothetical protein